MGHFNLPEGWTLAHYNDVYISASNGTGGSQNKEGVGIPVSRIETIANENIDYDRIGFLEKYDEAKIQRHKLMKGDILFSHINSPIHLGKTAIYDGKHTLYHGINLLRIIVDKSVILPQIFDWHCKYTRSQGEFSLRAQHAVNQSSLNQKKLGEFEIPIPPLAEQRVIVEKLDTLLAKVETTKARLERIPEILKTFRQSVLAAAVSGKLTEGWRLINGLGKKQFAEAIELTEFRGRKLAALPLSWQWLRFNQVAEIASNLVSPVDNPDAIHIAPNHIDSWTGSVSNFQTIFDDGVTSAKHRFTKGQIIYSKIRPYLAKVAIAEFDGLCSADMYPINSRVNTKFLFRWMLTSEFTDWASNAESRSVLPKINQKDLNKIPVPTPPIKEQAEIVKRIEDLFTFAESIEQKTNAALDRVNNLTQTILAKAFRGALTADWRAANYELITGENSVEALLEKIKAEREAIKPKKKAAPRKKG